MADFTFRYRLKLAPRSSISSPEPRVELLQTSDSRKVELASPDAESPLTKARDLVLRAAGWSSADQAEIEGRQYADRLAIALIHHRIGVYPADTAPRGLFFKPGLRMLEEQLNERVMNDVYGLTTYESEPPPRFASVGPVTVVMSVAAAKLRNTFQALSANPVGISNRERLAIDLFNNSFLESSSNTRLLTLVMAVESLLQLQPRSAPAMALVDSFLEEVAHSAALSTKEKDSLSGSLRYQRLQSISEAARTLVSTRLGGRRYMELSPAKFFTTCYTVRSWLVHGAEPRPPYQEVGRLAATLEVFVCDLLTQPFFENAAG